MDGFVNEMERAKKNSRKGNTEEGSRFYPGIATDVPDADFKSNKNFQILRDIATAPYSFHPNDASF